MPKRSKSILKEYFSPGVPVTARQFEELIDSLEDDNTPKTLEVSGGTITRTQRKHVVDTEGQASTDDLDTINGGYDGAELILRVKAAARVVTVKDGTGNINITGDCALNTATANLYLMYNGDASEWQEIQRNP